MFSVYLFLFYLILASGVLLYLFHWNIKNICNRQLESDRKGRQKIRNMEHSETSRNTTNLDNYRVNEFSFKSDSILDGTKRQSCAHGSWFIYFTLFT